MYEQARKKLSASLSGTSCASTAPARAAESQILDNEYPAMLRDSPNPRGRRILTLDPFLHADRPKHSANPFLIFSKCAAVRSKSVAIPNFPGCIYSEMKMCSRHASPDARIRNTTSRSARVLETLETAGSFQPEQGKSQANANPPAKPWISSGLPRSTSAWTKFSATLRGGGGAGKSK